KPGLPQTEKYGKGSMRQKRLGTLCSREQRALMKATSLIPSTIQSPPCHKAECRTPLSAKPNITAIPDEGLRTETQSRRP
ncbi:hypothetical protein TNCV_4411561, partial [Trichonephila clavipes]